MKPFSFYYTTLEHGAREKKATVYARTKNQARKMVANLYYIPEHFVREV